MAGKKKISAEAAAAAGGDHCLCAAAVSVPPLHVHLAAPPPPEGLSRYLTGGWGFLYHGHGTTLASNSTSAVFTTTAMIDIVAMIRSTGLGTFWAEPINSRVSARAGLR